MTSLDYRIPDDVEDQQFRRIATQTFNFPDRHWPLVCERVGRDQLRVVCDRGEVQAGLAFYIMGQWFGGNCLPTAGVALVCAAPHRRGQGVTRRLLTEVLAELRASGFALATLFASTQAPYRNVGFEQAGVRQIHECQLMAPAKPNAILTLTPVDPLEPLYFADLAERRARASNGNLRRSAGLWQRLFDPRDNPTPMRGYLVGDADKPVGYIVFSQDPAPPSAPRYGLVVRDLYAENVEAATTLWQFVYGHRAIATHVIWPGATVDPWLLTPRECQPQIRLQQRWMTRVLNVPQALSGRGFPPHVSGVIRLEVVDEHLPENHGCFELRVDNGVGHVATASKASMRIDIRGLACLYTGLYNADQLQAAGLLNGDHRARGLANALFAGPQPWMPDAF